jgi:ABC-type sugar transport system ATPase subunit
MAFESYVLYPNRTVAENMSFPLQRLLRDEPNRKAEIRERVMETASMLQIDDLVDRLPHALSGGQRQRVALGRALVRKPNALLLDEPIAHLDAKLRHWLRGELRRRLRDQGVATIWATPDSTEAMAVADRLLVIVEGRIEQAGAPEQVYARPATARVAELIGDPPMNLLTAESARTGIRLDGCESALMLEPKASTPETLGPVLLGARPSELQISSTPSVTSVPAVVVVTEPGAQRSLTTVRIGGQTVRVLSGPRDHLPSGAHVHIEWGGARVFVFEGEEDQRIAAESNVVGGEIEMPIGGGR